MGGFNFSFKATVYRSSLWDRHFSGSWESCGLNPTVAGAPGHARPSCGCPSNLAWLGFQSTYPKKQTKYAQKTDTWYGPPLVQAEGCHCRFFAALGRQRETRPRSLETNRLKCRNNFGFISYSRGTMFEDLHVMPMGKTGSAGFLVQRPKKPNAALDTVRWGRC